MFKQIFGLLLVGGLIGGGWWAYQNYDIRIVSRKGKKSADAGETPAPAPAKLSKSTIRIAALQLGKLDEAKLGHPRIKEVLGQIFSRFDVVAVQALHGPNQGMLVRLVELANKPPRSFDFAVSPNETFDGVSSYAAFLFDRNTIEVDRNKVSLVVHPRGTFRHRPLVGLFRAKGPEATDAFTFSLLSVSVSSDRIAEEVALLPDVYRAVRDNPWNEDDVIMIGTLHADENQLTGLLDRLHLAAVFSSTPTTTRGTQFADNILFSRTATREFTGRYGVTDLIREFNLTANEALEVSDHLPIWAEFSVYEGGQAGLIGGK